MKAVLRKSVVTLLPALLAALMIPAGAFAHDMWINMVDYSVSPSRTAVLNVGYGHGFAGPGGQFLARDRVEKVSFIDPKGIETPALESAEVNYESRGPLTQEGTYIAVAKQKGGFSSKTVEGYQRGKTKKDLKDVIQCKYSEKYGKALFFVGKPGGTGYSKPLGHKMEIVPLADPNTLREGDYLPVQVLFEGKPFRTFVYGVYAGFSTEPNVFAYTVNTNKEGVANVKILKAGIWLLIAKLNQDYPDPSVCDTMSCSAALTFAVP